MAHGAPSPVAAPGLEARRIAWEAVAAVLDRRAPGLDEVLDERGASREHALARAIAATTFRHLGAIRHALAARLAKGLPADRRLLALLATGAAQILFLHVPDHAAVDLAVRLARGDRRLGGFAGLVNAVLRRIAREAGAIRAEAEADPLGIETPDWLAARWSTAYGRDRAARIAAAHRQEAALDLTVRADPEAWAERLGALVLPTGSLRLLERTPVRELPGYAEGAWWVQDAAAALPARLLAARPGERVADLCAAPGGKTAQLAAAGAHVVAVDRSEARMRRLAENLARLRLLAETRVADVLALPDELAFDAVLIDAPCSATGTIRRHPDVAWAKRPDDVAALAALQARLLDKAAALVRPGGRLVYATCSLEPEEGEAQIEAFLAREAGRPFLRGPVDPAELGGLPELVNARGELRTTPAHLTEAAGAAGGRGGGLDGFFAARLVREA